MLKTLSASLAYPFGTETNIKTYVYIDYRNLRNNNYLTKKIFFIFFSSGLVFSVG